MYIKYILLVLLAVTAFLNISCDKAEHRKIQKSESHRLDQAQGYKNTRLDKYLSSKNPDYE